MKLKDILKVAAPVVLGPAVGGMFPGNPILSSALASGIGSIAFGQKPKDALRSAVLGGLGGAMFGGPRQAAQATPSVNAAAAVSRDPYAIGDKIGRVREGAGSTAGSGGGIASVFRGTAPDAEAKTMSGELLKSLKFAGSQDEGNLLFRLFLRNA
mgnify:FL=1